MQSTILIRALAGLLPCLSAVSLLISTPAKADDCTMALANTQFPLIPECWPGSLEAMRKGRDTDHHPDALWDDWLDDHLDDPPFVRDTDPFPHLGHDVTASIGDIERERLGYFWSAARGDGIVALEMINPWPSLERAILNVQVVDNTLVPGAFITWELLINDISVGEVTVDAGHTGLINLNVTFHEIPHRWSYPNPIYDRTLYGYDVEFRVVNEVPRGSGSISLAQSVARIYYAHSIELIGPSSDFCADFEHFTDGVTIELPDRPTLEGEVHATWDNFDGFGTEAKMDGWIDSNWVGVFTCDSLCADSDDWEFTVDILAGTGALRNLTTGTLHRTDWPVTWHSGSCPF